MFLNKEVDEGLRGSEIEEDKKKKMEEGRGAEICGTQGE